MKQKLFTRNFTFLILGQASSLIGNNTLKFALSMYVLERTGSAAVFAGLLAVAMVPTILLSPFGGMLADRMNRRNIMVVLDVISGLSVFAAFLLFGEGSGIYLIGALLVVLSVLGAFESPTVQACVPQMQSGDNILKGNAVVNQISAVAAFTTPFAGSIFYTAFGIRSVLLAAVICFFLTAFLECFIRLEHKPAAKQSITQIVKEDLAASMRFLSREQPGVLKLLLLAALVSFFVMGTAVVGFPFLVRTVLGLSAEHYGAAESAMGLAAILGGLAAGLLAGKLQFTKLYWLMIGLGICLLPSGAVFLLPAPSFAKYLVLVLAFCAGQAACNMFSIFALSAIQERTPSHLTGKVMSCVFTVSMCAQPLGQIVYGYLFDTFSENVSLVLLPTGIIICVIGWLSAGFFSGFGKEEEKILQFNIL